MKNFPVTVEGKEFWISRSIAASGYIFCIDNSELFILAAKRGSGAPDYQGFWNVPSGYLDYDETIVECCSREIAEETNLTVNPSLLMRYDIQDKPIRRQNVTFNYWTFSTTLFKGQTVYAKGAEPDEVEDVMWIKVSEIEEYEWAFDHLTTIMKIVVEHLSEYLSPETIESFKRKTTIYNA